VSSGRDSRAGEFAYKLLLSYDGSLYSGWQVQKGSQRDRPTVQLRLEEALQTITQAPREALRVQGASRTDAGVHARGQVAQFVSAAELDPDKVRRSLNGLLPEDIRVHEVRRGEWAGEFPPKPRRFRLKLRD